MQPGGVSMHAWIKKGSIPTAQALWTLGVCGQLAAMHSAGFVHRDLKPANILCNQVRIDLGKLTGSTDKCMGWTIYRHLAR
jgi:serine/threonine protein kinase